ncbi:hypothetical protein ACQW02_24150 [Humitalea sp. 24SJ18S-53]|uniref:hypothetical protein n=1 Tax=Humitalea sp. 24SJ18S-53 TaxID=3422307 RepID=UPI003D66AB53
MDDLVKRARLETYKTANAINYAFLQEGSKNYTAAESEKNTYASMLLVDADAALGSANKKVLRTAFGEGNFLGPAVTGGGGVGRGAYYNVLTAPLGILPYPPGETADLNYAFNPDVREWVFAPGKHASIIRGSKGKLLGGTANRPVITDRILCEEKLTGPIQRRADLLAHRRPKMVRVADGLAQVTIYHWHAPLGGDTTLTRLGLATGNEGIAGEGSGGEVAVAANLLFKKFLCGAGPFPARTLLVGDLNISPAAVAHIYGGVALGSEDGWCHVIGPPGATLTLLPGSNTMANALALGGSDHAPIVCDVTFP